MSPSSVIFAFGMTLRTRASFCTISITKDFAGSSLEFVIAVIPVVRVPVTFVSPKMSFFTSTFRASISLNVNVSAKTV